MKTIIGGFAAHERSKTGVRAKQPPMFFGQPVFIPPPRRRPLDDCRVLRKAQLVPTPASMRIACALVCYAIAFGTALTVWL